MFESKTISSVLYEEGINSSKKSERNSLRSRTEILPCPLEYCRMR